jgi:exodeoxyribonuclease-3
VRRRRICIYIIEAIVKVISLNIKGLNAAFRRGAFEWLNNQDADAICLQELSCRTVSASFYTWVRNAGYYAEVIPRSVGREGGGVAILSKSRLSNVVGREHPTLGPRGQYISATTETGVRIASVYLRYRKTEDEVEDFQRCFDELKASQPAIICGDFNIINDLARDSHLRYADTWPGYRRFEREWFARLLTKWIDVVPRGDAPNYTWWSSAAHFDRNHGTRVDYQLASNDLSLRVKRTSPFIVRSVRVSDHAPICVEYQT